MIHFGLMVLFAVAVGTVLALVLRREPGERILLAVWVAGGMILGAVLVGWLLRLLVP